MILIIGGAYQGKHQYVLENYSGLPLVDSLHRVILDQIEAGTDSMAWIREQLPTLKNSVIICEDISCGVVPIDPIMRQWRESLGHVLALVAREADIVVRVFCGIGTQIKP